MNNLTQLWVINDKKSSLSGAKVNFLGYTTGTRVKIQIAPGQPGAGDIYTIGFSRLTTDNPHAGYVAAEIEAVEFVPSEAHIKIFSTPTHRPAASLADILGSSFRTT